MTACARLLDVSGARRVLGARVTVDEAQLHCGIPPCREGSTSGYEHVRTSQYCAEDRAYIDAWWAQYRTPRRQAFLGPVPTGLPVPRYGKWSLR